MQYIHHRDGLIGHPQQHADIVAVDQLLEVAVHIELLCLIRCLGHLLGQRDHLEQRADLIRQHQRHIAIRFAANAHHNTDILGIGRVGLHLQLVVGAINKVARGFEPDGNHIILLLQRCIFLRQSCCGKHRRCCRAEHEHCCQCKSYQSFGLHCLRPPYSVKGSHSRAPRHTASGTGMIPCLLHLDFTAKRCFGQ